MSKGKDKPADLNCIVCTPTRFPVCVSGTRTQRGKEKERRLGGGNQLDWKGRFQFFCAS